MQNKDVTIGSYATSTAESRPWMTTKVTKALPKTRRSRPEPTVINQIFKSCADLTSDEVWINVFKSASCGRFPKGISFQNDFLIHKIRNKTSRITVPSDPEEALEICMNFFRTKAAIISQQDHARSERELHEYLLEQGDLTPVCWSNVRRAKVKDILVEDYIDYVASRDNLSQESSQNLRDTIKLGLFLGCFGNSNIVMKNGAIENIDGIICKSGKYEIDYVKAPVHIKKESNTDVIKVGKVSFYAMWLKFLITIEKGLDKKRETPTLSAGDSTPDTHST